MMSAPRVSVIIPVFNAAAFLPEALESVQTQRFDSWEAIVVDDGSTEDVAPIVKSFGPKMTFFSKSRGGPASARNLGLANAQGEFLAFLDADDVWHPEKLSIQLRCLENHPHAAAVFSDFDIVEVETGKRRPHRLSIADPFTRKLLHPESEAPSQALLERLLEGNRFGLLTAVARKTCLEAVGGFDEDPSLVGVEDYHLWLRLAKFYPLGYVDQSLATYRSGRNSLSADPMVTLTKAMKAMQKFLEGHPAITRALEDRRHLQKIMAMWSYELGNAALHQHLHPLARRHHLQALKLGGPRLWRAARSLLRTLW